MCEVGQHGLEVLARRQGSRYLPMSFPDLSVFPAGRPGPYERQMGRVIADLVALFSDVVPDRESNARVLELAKMPGRWLAAHAVFDEVRKRMLVASESGHKVREMQYAFEESCVQSLYNAMEPPDAFDPASPFFVASQSLALARAAEVPMAAVLAVLENSR